MSYFLIIITIMITNRFIHVDIYILKNKKCPGHDTKFPNYNKFVCNF